MLNDTIKYLLPRLAELNQLAKVSGIVDIVEEPTSTAGDPMLYPAVYIGRDSLRFVTDYDYKNGLAFFLRGRTTSSQEEGKRGCATFIRERQRPELIVIAARPEPGSIDSMIATLTKLLTIDNSKEARTATNTVSITGVPISFETEADAVLRDVFRNVEIKHRHDLMFLRVELDYDTRYYVNCLTPACP